MQVFFNKDSTNDQVAKAGETFLINLYGGCLKEHECDLNHLRYALFTKSALKSSSSLARLPPTADAARFHSLRSYHQIQKWIGNEKNPLEWGWVPTRFGLSPWKMDKDAAPESLLKMVSCNCKKACKNSCGCRKAGLICSSLCTCSLGESCENVSEIHSFEESFEDEYDTLVNKSVNSSKHDNIEDLNFRPYTENKEHQAELENFHSGPPKMRKL